MCRHRKPGESTWRSLRGEQEQRERRSKRRLWLWLLAVVVAVGLLLASLAFCCQPALADDGSAMPTPTATPVWPTALITPLPFPTLTSTLTPTATPVWPTALITPLPFPTLTPTPTASLFPCFACWACSVDEECGSGRCVNGRCVCGNHRYCLYLPLVLRRYPEAWTWGGW
jgi:hypothetical protein